MMNVLTRITFTVAAGLALAALFWILIIGGAPVAAWLFGMGLVLLIGLMMSIVWGRWS